MNKDEIRQQIREELARRDYLDYCRLTMPNWIAGAHIEYIGKQLEEFLNSNERILTLSIPPQHGKSMFITETLASYEMMKNKKRVILASYGDDLARRFGRRNRQKVKEFGHVFDIGIKKDSDTDLELDNGASMISRGIMAGITGQPADLIIIDDPIKNRQEADSETYRGRMWEEFLNSLYTRLSSTGKIILIMTRWHEDDLAGRLHNNMECRRINIPLEAEEGDLLSRELGDALFPEIGKDNDWLREFKSVYTSEQGVRAWNALMQGRPSSAEGNMLKRHWWQWYEDPPKMMYKLMSVDATFKDGDNNDYVAIQVWGKREADIYLIDSINEHLDFPGTIQAIVSMKNKHKDVRMILIEDKANGSAAIQVLRRKIPGIIPVNPEGGKVSRVNAISHVIESGNVHLPRTVWANQFVEQCSSFPKGAHDDMVDCMSQALNRFMFFLAEVPVTVKEDAFGLHKPAPTQLGGEPDKSYMGW